MRQQDAKQKEKIEAKNQGESLVYQTEKNLRELGDKVPADLKGQIESKSAELKKALEGDDIEDIKKKTDELMQVAHKVAEMVYKEAAEKQQAQEAAQPGAQAAGGTHPEGSKKEDDNVVDAEFKKAE